MGSSQDERWRERGPNTFQLAPHLCALSMGGVRAMPTRGGVDLKNMMCNPVINNPPRPEPKQGSPCIAVPPPSNQPGAWPPNKDKGIAKARWHTIDAPRPTKLGAPAIRPPPQRGMVQPGTRLPTQVLRFFSVS